ncbi:MAG: hypothetical protein LBR70_00500 [Lactobacillaceae bacterium]|jgi:hypothetical protein|nr:hypothetical protein [Lactobacillaceae bacterium]
MKKFILSPLFAPIATIILWGLSVWLIYIFYGDIFPEVYSKTKTNTVPAVVDKGGIIEVITNVSYILMFAAFLFYAKGFLKNDKKTDYFVFFLLAVSAFLRELGIQHWLTKTDSTAFKSRFFLKPENPLSEKITAGLILLIFFALLLYVLIKFTKYLIVSFFKLNPITWSIATLCGIMFLTKTADRFPAHYKKVHFETIDIGYRNFLFVAEETG